MSWTLVKLSTVCQIDMGSAPKGATYVELGQGVPLIAGAADYGEVFPNPKKATVEPTKLCQRGDIIICVRATIGDLNWADKEYCLGRGVAGLRTNPEQLDSKYLWFFISSYEDELYRNSTGSTFPQINKKVIESIEIPLPPLALQKQIAAVLEMADQLRKDCQQMEQELNSLVQSVFINMFGDPVTNPKGWEVTSLSSLGVVKGGLQVTSKRSVNPISVPYLRVANVYRDYLKLDEIKDILVTSKELERALLEKGDLLFVEGHGNENELGRAAVWNNEIGKCVHQNHLIRFRPGYKVRPQYVSSFVNSASGKRQLLSMSKTTSGLNTLSASNISSLQIAVPPIELQDKYLKFISNVLKQKKHNLQLNTELNEQFNSLMQQAFKGELNLADAPH